MKKIIFTLSLFIVSQMGTKAQGLQPGECGIMFTYDATGSLTQRQFFCNNTGAVIYQASKNGATPADSTATNNNQGEIIKVNALLPNPTSGKFTVRLAMPLKNENVFLMDGNGKVIQNSKKSGSELNFDISSFSSGIYFVKIESNGKMISLKVVKQ